MIKNSIHVHKPFTYMYTNLSHTHTHTFHIHIHKPFTYIYTNLSDTCTQTLQIHIHKPFTYTYTNLSHTYTQTFQIHIHKPFTYIYTTKTSFRSSNIYTISGNKYFRGGKYEQAIKCYTEAIETCPVEKQMELSTFYQNRAAAYDQLEVSVMFLS